MTPYATYQLSFCLSQVFAPFTFDSRDDGSRYLSLLADYAGLIVAIRDKTSGQAARGIRLPRPALADSREVIRNLWAAAQHVLIPSAERLTGLGSFGADIAEHAERLVAGDVDHAFGGLLEEIGTDYESRAPETVGVGQYPGGEEYYRSAIRLHNSVDLAPERIHATGVEQVELLTDRMARLRDELGFTGSESEFHAKLRAEPSRYAATPEDVARRYLDHLDRIEPALDRCFGVRPRARYGVSRLDPALEGGMTYGYYEPPTSAKPVGTYFYNGSRLGDRSLLTAAAIIYHELVPGHHFHLARQAENDALPAFRREALDFGAFNEGWAEYAAGLGWELGAYRDPYDQYGRLAHERFTAQRLVTDTGLNVLGWSLARAREYMASTTLESPTQIASETLRYSTGLPAQALGYRLGYLVFRQLRERTEQALGNGFSLPAFHDAILDAGALPLSVLEEHVDWFTAEQRK